MNTEFARLPVYFYGYDDIETFCLSKREQLVQENIGLILGILRGGAIPALMLSQMLGLPVEFVHYDRRETKAEINNKKVFDLVDACIKEGRRILLVDDVAGVGYTLANCYEYLLSFVKDESLIKVLTLVHHVDSRTVADHYKDCSSVRAVLPWERYVTSRQCLDDFVKAEAALLEDQRYKKTLAIDDSAYPLNLKHEWRVDCHVEFKGDHNSLFDTIKAVGPEEIYCNNESLIGLILDEFPFSIMYKTIKNKRYRISAFDQ
ncbi:phosphoribosyltransferase [Paraburkholderia nodosa]|uniref:phosphoribosyltransferase n=1 Tax=Paraburkholderia nodosa TaxID=392320 RepID=UPI0004830825|nr:phosphoribosyltransferase family protein [Paraburkholderia nodosa]